MAVTQQPHQIQQQELMASPGAIHAVPQGLEYLAQIDQLIVKQQEKMAEVLLGFECKNKYRIFNSVNQQVYYAFEESGLCMRLCCSPNHGFIMHITDNYQQEVLTIERVFKCCGGGCIWCSDGCCMYPVYVRDRMGNTLGMVRQRCSKSKPHFGIFDENDIELYDIWGPCCPCQCICGCTDEVKFPILNTKDRGIVGNISKIWAGALKELFSDADIFAVTFPLDLDTKHKALMLAAVFVIEFMVFEGQKSNSYIYC